MTELRFGGARMMVHSPVGARLLPIVAVAILMIALSNAAPLSGAQRPAPECHEWQECRQLALDARAAASTSDFTISPGERFRWALRTTPRSCICSRERNR